MSFNSNFPLPKDDNEEYISDEDILPQATVNVELDDFLKLHYHLKKANQIFEKYYKKGD